MAETEEKTIQSAEDLQVLGGMFNLAGALVHDEPQRAMLDAWVQDGLFAQVPLDIEDEDVREGFRLMNAWFAAYAEGDRDELCRELSREWLRLFVGVGQPQVPSWANYYFDFESRVLGRESLKVRETYRAFGLQIDDLNKEPDDNLGLMLKFLGFVIAQEAQAVNEDGAQTGESGEDYDAQGLPAEAADEVDRLRIAQTVFLKDHILPWVSQWMRAGEAHASSDFYLGAVRYVFGLVRWHAARLGFAWHEEDGSFSKGR